jgi:acyl-CoA dehydrogenase
MDFKPSPAVESLLERIEAFMAEHTYPNEMEVLKALDDEVKPGVPYPQILIELRAKAREEGLWNLFIADENHGAGLTNWEYGMLCEQMGRSPVAAPMSFNCAAPDTGNAEILIDHGTPEQKAEFLQPLLEGEARS